MSQPLTIIIVERVGTLKSLAIKDFKLDDFPNHTKKDTNALKMMKAYQNKLNMDYYQLHSDLDN
jgi:hypothetical protein